MLIPIRTGGTRTGAVPIWRRRQRSAVRLSRIGDIVVRRHRHMGRAVPGDQHIVTALRLGVLRRNEPLGRDSQQNSRAPT